MVNGYIEQYMDKEHPRALVSQTFVLNTSRLDRSNPEHLRAIQFREHYLEPIPADGPNLPGRFRSGGDGKSCRLMFPS